MRKLIVFMLGFLIFSVSLNAQKLTPIQKVPNEIKELFKDKSMIKYDVNVKKVFNKYQKELLELEYESYLIYKDNSPSGNVSLPLDGPFQFIMKCCQAHEKGECLGCGYYEYCGDCAWGLFGCSKCEGMLCPACGFEMSPFDCYVMWCDGIPVPPENK